MRSIVLTDRRVNEDGSRTAVLLIFLPTPEARLWPAQGTRKRPAWLLLYTLLPLTIGLFLLAERIPEWSLWRPVAECAALILVFGAALAWVRANRLAFTHSIGQPESLPAERGETLHLPTALPAPVPAYQEASASGPSWPPPAPPPRSMALS